MNFQIVAFVGILASAQGQLRCYDCDPDSEGRCLDPDQINSPVVACPGSAPANKGVKKVSSDFDQTEIETKDYSDIIYECFSMYYRSGSDEEPDGVYRGCKERTDEDLSSCAYLREELLGNVAKCRSCAEDLCNVVDVGGSVASQSASLVFVLLASCIHALQF